MVGSERVGKVISHPMRIAAPSAPRGAQIAKRQVADKLACIQFDCSGSRAN
ncbi:hypothetical protein Pan161_21380 [Gimesia algae]|uniref:Uncharacterized protein n=1 Tax=Gimesia algae TaxID=2527971 RepID=A0A517VBW5_9PLAN|nr:hypothetical protein Pan161_21380 [Gimesia algae]